MNDDLDKQIDRVHGPGAAAALNRAIADGSVFSFAGQGITTPPPVDGPPDRPPLNRLAERHDQDEGCYTNAHCVSHNVDELDQPGDYKVCGECGHIFRTEFDLIAIAQVEHDAFRRSLSEEQREDMPQFVGPADRILSCPLCTHDF